MSPRAVTARPTGCSSGGSRLRLGTVAIMLKYGPDSHRALTSDEEEMCRVGHGLPWTARRRERPVARFVTFFSYTPEAWARLIDNPGDRSGPVSATITE